MSGIVCGKTVETEGTYMPEMGTCLRGLVCGFEGPRQQGSGSGCVTPQPCWPRAAVQHGTRGQEG